MIPISVIEKFSNKYFFTQENLFKFSKIRKLPNGKYRVLSEKGKNLGTYPSESGAKKRLRQVEFFKHKDLNGSDDLKIIDLTDIDDFSYSAIVRKLREKAEKEEVYLFLEIYKKNFDKAVKEHLQKPEKIALQNSLIKFNKTCPIKLKKKLLKNASLTELGNAALVGKYLADIVKFTLNRISPEGRIKAINSLRHKFYVLNAEEISNKKMPPTSSIGSALTFVKHVLFNHDPQYIREVLNNLVRYLS